MLQKGSQPSPLDPLHHAMAWLCVLAPRQSLRTFKNKFFGFARQIDRVPLMLAVAHSLPLGQRFQGVAVVDVGGMVM